MRGCLHFQLSGQMKVKPLSNFKLRFCRDSPEAEGFWRLTVNPRILEPVDNYIVVFCTRSSLEDSCTHHTLLYSCLFILFFFTDLKLHKFDFVFNGLLTSNNKHSPKPRLYKDNTLTQQFNHIKLFQLCYTNFSNNGTLSMHKDFTSSDI